LDPLRYAYALDARRYALGVHRGRRDHLGDASSGRKARREALNDLPIAKNTLKDYKALAQQCVTAVIDGLPEVEPWIHRKQLDDLLDHIPNRLVLVGPEGAGKSRVATEIVRRLQSTADRSILLWERTLPSREA